MQNNMVNTQIKPEIAEIETGIGASPTTTLGPRLQEG
jgi:hypothetical protein